MRAVSTAVCLLLVSCSQPAAPVLEPTDPAPADPAPAPAADPEPPQHGRATVEELVEDLVRGFQHGNMQELLSLFPPEAILDEALRCPHGNMLAEEVAHNQQDLEEALAEMAGVGLELVGIAPRKGKTTSFEAGAYVEDGCSAGAAITLREVVVIVRITEGGATEEETADFLVMQVGGEGPWYLLGPD